MDTKSRVQTVLAAAAKLIIQQGYDKTTMSDIADAAGINRALIYPHFKSKDDILAALIAREVRHYSEVWLTHLLEDPQGGTIASIHRSIAFALNQCPLMAAIVTRDDHVFGKYLRKPGNLFATASSVSTTRDFLQALQSAGAIRSGVNIPAMAYLMDMISYGLIEGYRGATSAPPYDQLLETVAEMYDRMLTPEDGGNLEDARAIIRQLAEQAKMSFSSLDDMSNQLEPA